MYGIEHICVEKIAEFCQTTPACFKTEAAALENLSAKKTISNECTEKRDGVKFCVKAGTTPTDR